MLPSSSDFGVGQSYEWQNVPLNDLIPSKSPCYTEENGAIVGLSLAGAGLTEIPSRVFNLNELRVLRLTENRLTNLPDELESLQQLRRLYVSWNHFEVAPALLRRMIQLRVLALNGNQLSKLPDWFAELRHIRTLGLQSAGLAEMPQQLRSLAELRCLFLGANPITRIPEWISELKSLHQLSLSSTSIQTLPESLARIRHLNYLSLDKTALKDFPQCVLRLRRLGYLSLDGTSVSTIPDEIGNLIRLSVLDLTGTGISRIPDTVANLVRLRRLRVGDNPGITDIPDALAQLHRLIELDLHGTHINHIPPTIARLRGLRRLDLSNAALLQLSPAVLKLPNLVDLNLISNKLRELPVEIADVKIPIVFAGRGAAARGVFLGRNPLVVPPPEIARNGDAAVRTYLRSLKSQTRPTNEVKVILIGDGGSGKTSLVLRLTHDAFEQNSAPTAGIAISDGWLRVAGQRIRLHFWDFGGQEIMHATHQFFLSHRSAYVLVLDGRRDDKAEYWLKHIEAFGGDSPVVVVTNKIDEHPAAELNRRFLLKKYPFITEFVKVSCKSKVGIETARQALADAIQKVDFIRTEWPVSWLAVKEEVISSTADFIGFDEFRRICLFHGVTSEVEQETLIGFLHDLGIVLRFEDLALRDTGVLNPRWVTNGVYQIINSKVVASAGGILDVNKLHTILSRDTHPAAKHNFIVELMKKFELCYMIGPETALLPGLLPLEEPPYALPAEGRFRFFIQYEFLPPAVILRLIVRMHADIHKAQRWRSGAVFYNEGFGSFAVVHADETERRLQITVQGTHRREYFAVILNAIREINRSFTRIKVEERVVMPDNPNISVSFSHLLKLEAMQTLTFLPEEAQREYRVDELLGWVRVEPARDDEVLKILRLLKEKTDTPETMKEKANAFVTLKPNLFGIGIDLNEMIKRLFPKASSTAPPEPVVTPRVGS